MSKRFTDTDKWKRAWFRKLSPTMKCVWEYLRDNCDHAGVWLVDMERLAFDVGTVVLLEDILREFHGRVFIVSPSRLFIPSFIRFQYGELKENNKAHIGVVRALKEHGLTPQEAERLLDPLNEAPSKPLPRSLIAPQEQEQEQDKEKDKEQEQEQEQEPAPNEIERALIEKLSPQARFEAQFDERWPEYRKSLASVLQPIHLTSIEYYRPLILKHFRSLDDLRDFMNPHIKNLRRVRAATKSEVSDAEESATLFKYLKDMVLEWERLSKQFGMQPS